MKTVASSLVNTRTSLMSAQKKFGGKWSDVKLDVLKEYLDGYSKVLKKSQLQTVYIDAFAGAGTQEEGADSAKVRHGSPFIALNTIPAFDAFVFIEKDKAKLDRLKEQVEKRGFGSRKIRYRAADANAVLENICARADWKSHRAVAFLDPFALQVKWSTIQAIAETKAIDMWLLFPAMAVNRMLATSGRLGDGWEEKLDITFGASSWKDAFYQKKGTDLFGNEWVSKKTKPFDILADLITVLLNKIFVKALDKPLVLKNSAGTPLFILCFACGNEKGAGPALRIANHIIKNQNDGN